MSNGMLGGITLAMVAGLINDLFSKLTGPEGQMWLTAFKRFLRKENPWPRFQTWKTITIGNQKSVSALVKAMEAQGQKIEDSARDILNKVALAKKPEELELVMVSVADLGFKDGANRQDIYDRAISLGLAFCPAEVSLQLRLQYMDQPEDESLMIAMDPDVDGYVFCVDHGRDGFWLDFDGSLSHRVWCATHCWVFLQAKKS